MTRELIDYDQQPKKDRQPHNKMLRALVGGVAVGAVLSGCVGGPSSGPSQQRGDRPAPASDNYFHDVTDPYYQNVANVLPHVDESATRSKIERILDTPVAQWLNVSTKETVRILKENIELSARGGGIPMFVAYNIPFRDLGGASSGGAIDGLAYRKWIKAVSQTIGNHPSIVILEPDALVGAPDITDESMRSERYELLRDAIQTMRGNNPNTAVYLDAGHSKWESADVIVELIRKVDPSGDIVRGLSLNVSNQRPENEIREYAAQIWQKLGYKPYIMIDNAMNGAPNTGNLLEWCNADGEKIGTLDDYYFDKAEYVEEAYIKPPGESDAACGTSTKEAGEFDAELLLKQVSE